MLAIAQAFARSSREFTRIRPALYAVDGLAKGGD
jgi:hypothetical protein